MDRVGSDRIGDPGEARDTGLARAYATVVGVVLVAVGLLGFIDNPIVGSPHDGTEPIFVADTVHNLIHIVTGLVALAIAFGMSGLARANALIAFGVVYAAVLVLTLIDADLFGILGHPVNAADHLLHLVLAVLSIGIGLMERSRPAGAWTR